MQGNTKTISACFTSLNYAQNLTNLNSISSWMECLDLKKLMSKMSGKKMGEEFFFQLTIFLLKPVRSFE